MKLKFNCAVCGAEFLRQACHVKQHPPRYCTRACQQVGRRGRPLGDRVEKETISCRRCGKEFQRRPAEKRGGRCVFCSKECYWAAKEGKPLTERHIRIDNGYAYYTGGCLPRKAVHRAVVEEFLGRELDSSEHVHHDNEIRDDNNPNNLVLLGHAEHMSHHAKNKPRVNHRWAKESSDDGKNA